MMNPGLAWQDATYGMKARDIAVGGGGHVYIIADNGAVMRWTGRGWTQASNGSSLEYNGGYVEAVAAGPDGKAWIFDNYKNVSFYDPAVNSWHEVEMGTFPKSNDSALYRNLDIGVGDDGVPWVSIWDTPLRGIWNLHPGGFGLQGGHASRISGGIGGEPWHIGDGGNIYRWHSCNWIPVPGFAFDIGVGFNGSAWHIGSELNIYYMRDDGGWSAVDQVVGGALRISVGPDGLPWVVNPGGAIFKRV